jgi:transposase
MARKASGAEQLELALRLLKKAKTVEELRAAQAIALPLILGLNLKQTATAIGRSVGATCTMRIRFGRTLAGEAKATRSKRELRNRAKASLERESQILDEVLSEAKTGGVVIVPPLKPAIEAKLGKTLALSTLYQMLSRHGWRKLVPDKSHPEADPAARDAWEKNSPSGWQKK